MAQKSINKLTNEELNLICSTEYPMLKKSAMGKIRESFNEIGLELSQAIETKLPDYKRHYKISSGENFENCPYLVLDIPQIKTQNFGFVFRIFFRWGHHFALQCIVENENFDVNGIFNRLIQMDEEVFVLLGSDPWENKIEDPSYVKIDQLNPEDFKAEMKQKAWFKFCTVLPIKKPDDLHLKAIGFYDYLLQLLVLSAK